VNAYDSNSAIVVDDECTWVSTKGNKGFGTINNEEFKNIVTNATDMFSRKHMNPEEHARSFIIIRTSNDVNQVYSTNERRQIIFQCNLAEQECRILNLPDEFFEQMLAEAKDYYVKHGGRYQLTDDDKLEIKETNLNNYNVETKENFAIMGYIKDARANPDLWCVKLQASKFRGEKWGNYQKYAEWCEENKKPSLSHRPFWRSVSALSEYPEYHIAVMSDKKYELADGGKCRVFRIDPVSAAQPADEVPDIPY
jgi:predicted P-loop ATPase